MNGFDKIIERIQTESAAESEEILALAEEKRKIIEKEHEENAAKLAAQIELALNAELALMRETAKGQAETDGKKMILNAEQGLVLKIIDKALEKVQSLPDGEYFSLLTKLLYRHLQDKSGEILISEKDAKRISPEFSAALERGKLQIVEDENLSGGGFVLRYGEIEENCTFPALFAAKKEAAQDTAYKILFG